MYQAVVVNFGERQHQLMEIDQPFQVDESSSGDAGVRQFKPLELGQPLEMCQSRVRNVCPFEVDVVELLKSRDVRESGVGDAVRIHELKLFQLWEGHEVGHSVVGDFFVLKSNSQQRLPR